MDEQEANDRFVRLVGGVKRADRLQQIWNMSFPHGMRLCNYVSREDDFRRRAKAEGYTDREIDAFLNLP